MRPPAIGVCLPVHEPAGNIVVDISRGTTKVTIISLGGIMTASPSRIRGNELDEAIMSYIRKTGSLMLGDTPPGRSSSSSARPTGWEEEPTADVKGRDLVPGLPKTIGPVKHRNPARRSRNQSTRSSMR